MWQRYRRRFRYWLNRAERDRLLWEEMEFHIAAITDDLVARGWSVSDARAAARRKFGNMTQTSENARSTWIARWLSDLSQDLRQAFRGMRRDAGFTAFTVLITGLGIGASSTVFSVVNAMMLRPLPFHDPGRLVWMSNGNDLTSTQTEHFSDLLRLNRSFTDLAAFADWGVGNRQLTGDGEPERLTSVPVTSNFFPLLGVQPLLGRSFTQEECQGRYAAPPATLLSYNFWQRRFGADPNIVGRKITLDNQPVIVAGVLPPSFEFGSIFVPGTPADIFVPWPLADPAKPQGNTMRIVGRLKSDVTIGAAQSEMTALGRQLEREHSERNGIAPRLVPLARHVSGPVHSALFVLACAVGVVMLIVCANLSNLQFARMAARQKEMALRTALGAGRSRLLRQLITESVTLSCCGAVLGLTLAFIGVRGIARIRSLNLPLLDTVKIDASALAFTLLAAVLTGVLFGLLPAWQASSTSLRGALDEGTRGSSRGRRHAWIRDALVVTEVAFACALLVGAGLFIRSFVRVLDVKLGFQPERAAALRIDPGAPLGNLARQNAFLDEVLRRTRDVPGIAAAGVADVLPLRDDRGWSVSVRGRVYQKTSHPEPFIRVVTDGYFEAAGISLRSGRLFAASDRAGTQPVVLINETMARTVWPGESPLGQTITTYSGQQVIGVVIGVVGDVRHEALERASGPELYLAMRQTGDYAAMHLVLRTTLSPDRLSSALRSVLRPLDPNLPVRDVQNFQTLVDRAVSPRRALVLLLGAFAAFSLGLASLGIYAVISYSVSQRGQEIGIRLALGASPSHLQRAIVLRTLALAAVGLALGMAGARILSTTLGSLLFEVTPGDPVTFLAMASILLTVAAIAGYIPAVRASRIDPMGALRSS